MLFFTSLVLLLGLAIGSFANCLIWRLYKEERIMGRSRCPLCASPIAWHDNIPVLSFIWLKGRCRHCRANISYQYPIVELVMAFLFLFFWFQVLNFQWLSLDSLLLVLQTADFYINISYLYLLSFVLLIIFVFDFRYYLVSTVLVWPATLVFLVFNILFGFTWYLILFSMLGAGLFFLLQFISTRGRGIGEGDIWLGVLLGAVFPQALYLIFSIFSAYILGSLTGIILIILGHKSWGSKLPLGVFLSSAAILTLILGEFVDLIYNTLFRL